MKHLTTTHASTKLVAKNTDTSATDDSSPSTSKELHRAKSPKQLDLSASQQKSMTQAEVNRMKGRYSMWWKVLYVAIIDGGGCSGTCTPCSKTFANYLDAEYSKMNKELKKCFEELDFLSITADIWTAHNYSYLGVTAHWLDPHSLERKKAALACRCFKSRHTYDSIATELDNIHSSFSISHKIKVTVTDNRLNFIKAFKV